MKIGARTRVDALGRQPEIISVVGQGITGAGGLPATGMALVA